MGESKKEGRDGDPVQPRLPLRLLGEMDDGADEMPSGPLHSTPHLTGFVYLLALSSYSVSLATTQQHFQLAQQDPSISLLVDSYQVLLDKLVLVLVLFSLGLYRPVHALHPPLQ